MRLAFRRALRAILYAARDSRGLIGPVTDHTLLTNIGTNTHAQIDTHLAASAAVHGLPASVNVLGNRSAAGEFVQRGSVDSGVTGSDVTFHASVGVAVTFAVAFSSTPQVFTGIGTSAGGGHGSGGNSRTTTGFNIRGYSFGGTDTPLGLSWLALGS